MKLRHAYITSVVRCAPPADKPTPDEIKACALHLAAEIRALPRLRTVVCLGRIAWNAYLACLLNANIIQKRSLYSFRHGAEYPIPNDTTLVGSYHPSLRNTNTGRLDAPMLHQVFTRARTLAGL
jgi:uracil-DNA glycosylase family 4